MDELFGSDDRYAKGRFLAGVAQRSSRRALLADPNITGTGFGRRTVRGEVADEPALVVYVLRKVPASVLPPSRLLPRRLYIGADFVEVDVVETGPIHPLSFTARERPAPSGISIAHPAVTAGTLGCLVRDNADDSLCILSNNHVLANQNAASPGDPILQPGPADGGTSPADDIATLTRFVPIGEDGNTVDGAIAAVNDVADVEDRMKDDLMPVANQEHPAVGLLFAGGCNRAIMNPIVDVLVQLDVALPAGPGSVAAADLGMALEKVGRTTEYTTSTVTEIDVTVRILYDFGPATFDRQIAAAWMASPGDSGSLVCRGGAGGLDDRCA